MLNEALDVENYKNKLRKQGINIDEEREQML